MIRTPLARRIGGDEVLNTVDLFLPHYDKENLDQVLEALRSPDAHDGLPTEVVTQATEYPRNGKFADVFEHLAALKTFSIDRAPRMSDLKRVLRLSGLLMHEGIDEDADGKLRETLVEKLAGLRDGYSNTIADWSDTVREGGEIEVDVTSVTIGALNVIGRNTTRMDLSAENIDHLFEEAGRVLAAGEGLHRSYWKRYQDKMKPNECKLELFAITWQSETAAVMEKLAASEFRRMWNAHAAAISKLPAADRSRFQQLKLASGRPVEHEWMLPDQIVEKPGQFVWREHLYADANGEFTANLNGWETAFLSWMHAQKDFVCWLRNSARRDWAFCLPYEKGGEKGFYPDFVIVRKQDKGFIVDILEPHDDTRTDTWAKVKGLAKFADTHGINFGRLMVGRIVGEKLEVVDVADYKIREKARKMGAPADLEALFNQV